MTNHLKYVLLVALTLANVAVLSRISFGAGWNGAIFQPLSQEDKLAFVLAAIRSRDAHLQNCSIQLSSETLYLKDANAAPQVLYTRSIDFKRNGRKCMIRVRELGPEGDTRFNFLHSWDGVLERALNFPNDQEKQHRGTIADHEPPILQDCSFFNLLGFRTSAGGSLTLPEWLEAASKAKSLQGIAVVERDGRTLIEIHQVNFNRHQRYWLDPTRGYLPVRFEFESKRPNGGVGNWEKQWVEDAKQFGEVWIPTKVVKWSGTSEADYNIINYSLSQFASGSVTDKDCEVTFPVDTEVVDVVTKVAYRIKEDGSQEVLPLYDPKTGKVTKGGKVVSSVTSQPSKIDMRKTDDVQAANPLATSTGTLPDSEPHTRKVVIICGTIGLLLL